MAKMSNSETSGTFALLARWRGELDGQTRRELLRGVLDEPVAEACSDALELLLEDDDLSPGQCAELGWLLRQLQCWTIDSTLLGRIRSHVASTTEPERLRALLETAYDTGTPEGVDILEDVATDDRIGGSLRGFAIERIGLLANASERMLSRIRLGLEDRDPEIRFWSCYALAALGDVADIPAVENLLFDRTSIDPFGTIAEEAMTTIEAIRIRAASELA